MKTDMALQRDVTAELARDPYIRDENIGTDVHDGVVTLTGVVDDYAQRRVAEVSAARVAGVRAVVQELSVDLPIEPDQSDSAIAHQAVEALERNSDVPQQCILVFVENAWVALSGIVDHERQRRAAEQAIANIPGVRGIRNLVELRPHATAAEVESHIRAALQQSAEVGRVSHRGVTDVEG